MMAMDPQTPQDLATLKANILAQAQGIGFDAMGVTRPDAIPHMPERLHAFLKAGHHGTMDWLATRAEQRGDPRALWPDVRSVIMLGTDYAPGRDPMALLDHKDRGIISVYAQGSDYHDVIKKRLKRLARWLAETTGAGVKVFVDTAPVAEKPLAEAAGLGWQGKHTNLVAREGGSWLFLGAIFTTLDLPADGPETDHCGRCRRCLDICPTDAFPAPYQLDARRCLSYLTIEHKGPIPHAFRAAMGNRIYGCDDCLAVCPWNKFARQAREAAFLPRGELTAPRLGDLAALNDASFREVFAGSPVKRIGRDRFVRNVMIAIGNSQDRALAAAAERGLTDDSPLVRGAAVWAFARLASPEAFTRKRATLQPHETDTQVQEEWRMASGSAAPIVEPKASAGI